MKNAGIQVDTPEVLLSHQGLLEVCSFERLKCMEALWLNDNLLNRVEGLDTNLSVCTRRVHTRRGGWLEKSSEKTCAQHAQWLGNGIRQPCTAARGARVRVMRDAQHGRRERAPSSA